MVKMHYYEFVLLPSSHWGTQAKEDYIMKTHLICTITCNDDSKCVLFIFISVSETHKILERFVLEGTLNILLLHIPYHGQGHIPLDQVSQSPLYILGDC